MCKYGTGKQGPQGPQGPTGAAGSSSSLAMQTNKSVGGPTTVNIITSASKTGQVRYGGFFNISSTGIILITLTPVINGVAQTALQIVHGASLSVGGNCYSTIPVSGLITILQGQTFDINVTLNSYAASANIVLSSVNYAIQ